MRWPKLDPITRRRFERFRRIKLQLVRAAPRGRSIHKLDVAWDRGKKRVPPSHDYAIHPNDRLMVIEDTSTVIDDMLARLTGPFGEAAVGHLRR